ncbi:uncharacterized protein LOC126918474 isoform X1 [Bombus affinis]|uniref:uncharacterized protein LOC126918474 isoform X1 n=1 Tax=Bombus affinis TaxID=309941 RepID=UPI0021B7F445|nr:uncharacterized protein LOC126918474 isoform X1 [Bombus affinis]XP_050582362.1 uncharacterized protein LOC126918474 isoform X1 [Bombus affinis]XP_050582372.1 uncharacterized protein LOC126918474 isoform X1 [Bombus affinis]XP_050582381.1 uncharacterized protein LOC126918474 isoform X1 [Bombus affinis]XP_050582389.1 uncharacterized protein LOC126918474 isoform X1 [Bombus affinis]XP_050582397.1 uncharacterized protein LOC126918474 isoform X1 [Bombus affinis]
MGLNAEVTAILRDVVQFLECLHDVKLPMKLENIRDNLLVRSKDTLTMFVIERIGRPASPEPYLNMNATGSKGLTAATLKTETELQEYVGAEEYHEMQKPQQQQDYYETFQGVESTNNTIVLSTHETIDNIQNKEEEVKNTLMDIYANFSATETKSKCKMCGPLYRKEGKKLFVFEQYRACWVGLVGLHLLIYGNDRDNRPCTILPIQGYMARPAPNAIPRDQRRSESTFEIFRPGNRTFQFSAKTRKDMEQWVTKICELGGEKNDYKETTKQMDTNIVANGATKQPNDQEDSNCRQELADKSSTDPIVDRSNEDTNEGRGLDDSQESANISIPSPATSPSEAIVSISSHPRSSTPPPLPARISRKLPMPSPQRSSYELPDEEEDDIYHKIEDFRETIQYANVRNKHESDEKGKKGNFEIVTKKSIGSRKELTYDDTTDNITALKDKVVNEQSKFLSYDHGETVIRNSKSIKVRTTEKVEESAKSPQKKSFLDRVRSKKESPRKIEKKTKYKTATSPSRPPAPLSQLSSSLANNQESSSYYDDVSELINVEQEINRLEEEQSEYTCPPPPRPIYVKPPIIENVTDADEFYDDVAYRDKSHQTCSMNLQQITKKSNLFHNLVRTDADRPAFCENLDVSQQSFEDNEHYKMPRPESHYPRCLPVDQQVDDLYDDVAILAEFTARQKEVLHNRDNENATRSQISPEKKSWNRFVSGKRSKTVDSMVTETNGRVLNETEDSSDDFGEQHNSSRMNTFQKLISRMENSLGKAPSRTTSSILLNKTNLTKYV